MTDPGGRRGVRKARVRVAAPARAAGPRGRAVEARAAPGGSPPRTPIALPPPPAPSISWAAVIFGALGVLAGGALALLSPFAGVPYAVVGALLLAREAYRLKVVTPAQVLSASFHALSLGRLGQAEALLDAAERSGSGWALRIADIQRAVIQLRRGDLAAARARLDAAIARPLGRLARANAAYQIEGALALRAFVRASLGDADGARADAAAVRAGPAPAGEALARAALAEAILLENAGDRAGLRDHLARHKGLLLESTHPRERAIVRAYQRMLKVTATSVYREGGKRDDAASAEHEEPMLADWVAKVAPGTAPFVRVVKQRTGDTPDEAVPRPHAGSEGARRAVLAARAEGARAMPKSTSAGGRVIAIGGAAVGLAALAALAVALIGGTSAPVAPSAPHDYGWVGGYLVMIAGGATLYAAFGLRRRVRRGARRADLARLGEARAALGRGDLEAAARALEPLRDDASVAVAAQADLLASIVAERRARFDEMRRSAERGLARIAEAKLRGGLCDALLPELVAQRAFALALADRADEAEAELASLSGSAYPYKARDLFRVRLVELTREGRIDVAAALVDGGALDLPLGVRDELLADLVRAVAAPGSAGLGELARLKDELRLSPESKAWIEAAAPGLVERFGRATEADEASLDRVSEPPAGERASEPPPGERASSPVAPPLAGENEEDEALQAELEADAALEADIARRRR